MLKVVINVENVTKGFVNAFNLSWSSRWALFHFTYVRMNTRKDVVSDF